jgi:hypothetical protein
MMVPQPQSQNQHDAAYKKYGDDDLPFSHVLKVKDKSGLCKKLAGFCWRFEKGDMRLETQDARQKTQDTRSKSRESRTAAMDHGLLTINPITNNPITNLLRHKKREARDKIPSFGQWSIDSRTINQ